MVLLCLLFVASHFINKAKENDAATEGEVLQDIHSWVLDRVVSNCRQAVTKDNPRSHFHGGSHGGSLNACASEPKVLKHYIDIKQQLLLLSR